MKNILFVSPQLASGGIEQLAKQWAPVAKEQGFLYVFSVTVEGGSTYEYFRNGGYKIISTKAIGECGIRQFISQYIRIIKENKIDIIHIPASLSSGFILLAAFLSGCKKRIVHAHTNFYNTNGSKTSSSIELFFARTLNNVFSTDCLSGSESAAEYCFGKKHNYLLIKNGINIEKFRFKSKKREEKRKELNIEDSFVIGNIGRFTYQKNQRFVIRILKVLCEKYNSNCKLIFLGEGEDELKLRDCIRSNNLEDNVLFLGTDSDLSSYYQAMDAFVFPSLFEGLGIAAVEAQASGTLTYISENVPDDAIISSSTKKISLSEGEERWADVIWSNRLNRNENGYNDAVNAGYSENDTIQQVIDVYKRDSNDR